MGLTEALTLGIPAVIGAVTGWFVAPRTAAQTEQTKRIDLLLDHQGQELERLGAEVKELREDFKKEQELTQTLKEESNKWRELLKLALSHLRILQEWREKGHPPPPPEMPLVLGRLKLEDL